MNAGLGVQLYSLGATTTNDLPGTIARIAALGFAAVEPVLSTGGSEQVREFVARLGPDLLPTATDVVALKRALDAHGMVTPSCHVHLPEGEQAQAVLDEQEQLGSTMLITPFLLDPDSGSFEAFSDLDQIKKAADRFNRAAELARTRGMRVGYHNHSWEVATDFDGRSGLEVFYELCDPEVIAEIDVYWALVGGRDPVELVRALGDRVALLHVKDGDGGGELTSSALGTGVVDLPAVLAAAPAAQLHIVELEGMDDDTIWPALDMSARYLVDHELSTSLDRERGGR